MQPIQNFDFSSVPNHAICCAVTETPPYEGYRILYIEHWPKHNDYTIVNGEHCSCYGFDEVRWDAAIYSAEEIAKLMKSWQINGTGIERKLAHLVLTVGD